MVRHRDDHSTLRREREAGGRRWLERCLMALLGGAVVGGVNFAAGLPLLDASLVSQPGGGGGGAPCTRCPGSSPAEQSAPPAPAGAEPAGPQERPPPLRTAVYAVLVLTEDGYKKQNLLLNSIFTKCSAECFGSKVPWHVILAGRDGEVKERAASLLQKFGWIIEDHTDDVDYVKSIFKPVYSGDEARRMGRWWPNFNKTQERKDGWATYLKFYAWQALQYDRVLMTDMDVMFMSNPDEILQKIPRNVTFMASKEKKYDFYGINSHMMVLAPSKEIFQEFMTRAELGEYLPFTNTEQDIVEALYPPRLHAKKRMQAIIPHEHFVFGSCPQEFVLKRLKYPKGWVPKDCKEVVKVCDFTKTGYKESWLKLVEKCT